MSTRSSSFAPVSYVVTALALLALLGAPACGRSNLDDYLLPDGGFAEGGPHEGGPGDAAEGGPDVIEDLPGTPDVLSCNATTCPGGCCDTTGRCQAGSNLTQCGALGEACANCAAEGFQLCDPTRHACGNPVVTCDSANCAGCCEGTVCLAGSDPNECGFGGESCQQCETSGLVCTSEQCEPGPCGPENCTGCCFGQECITGTNPTACGAKGQVCTNCSASGETCEPTGGNGGQCIGQPTCSAANCNGCCQGNVCLPGNSSGACGEFGQACSNCQSTEGFCQVQPSGGGICQGSIGCGPQNCPGCCEGQACVQGTDPNACGIGGQSCADCTSVGGFCVAQGGFGGFCETNNFCDSTNCDGCCDFNGNCQPGTTANECGVAGGFCNDCTATPGGGTCSAGLCQSPPPVCDPSTCPSGCCDGTNCLPGSLNTFCGTGGQACTNCETAGGTCSKNACVAAPPKCDASNCTGCCDQSDVCQAGFVDTQCGQNGASCEDCTGLVPTSTCDVNVSPRTCQSQQTQCPAPYPSCPGALETPSPTQQAVCSASDLQNAGSACEGGAHDSACQAFFGFEKSSNPSCATCLTQFDYDFSELTGLTTCAAPFVDAACNHITACLVDCTDKSCANCVDTGALQDCQVQVPQSVCASYYDGAACIDNSFFGSGSFCDPNQGTGLFGDWLVQVGGFYCGQTGFVDAGFGGD
ncbi:MAG TPA: hypothetical protein VGG39_06415 [Polyangiaceae bacterium]